MTVNKNYTVVRAECQRVSPVRPLTVIARIRRRETRYVQNFSCRTLTGGGPNWLSMRRMKNFPARATSQTRNSFPNSDRTSFTEANNLSAGHSLSSKLLSLANFADGSEIVMATVFPSLTLPAVCPTKNFFGRTGEGGLPTIARQTIENDQTPAKLTPLSTGHPNDNFAFQP